MIAMRPRLLMNFTLRCVRFYPGVNSRAELVTLAPGLCPERRFAPLARGLRFQNAIIEIHHRYINNILTALSTYSNIVGHVHGSTLKRPPYCVHKYFMPQHVLSRNFRKNRNTGWLIDILHCNLWASYILCYSSYNLPMPRITANNDKQ